MLLWKWNEELDEVTASGFLSEVEILRLALLFYDLDKLYCLWKKAHLLKPLGSTKYTLAGF